MGLVCVFPPSKPPITYIGSSSTASTSSTLTAPAGAQVGDLLIAVAAKYSAGSTPLTWPSGWVVQNSVNGTNFRQEVAIRPHDGSASWTIAGSVVNACDAYRNANTAALIASAISTLSVSAGAAQATPSLANTDPAAWRVCCFVNASSPARTWDSYSPADLERGSEGVGTQTFTLRCAITDSNGPVPVGSSSVAATQSGTPNFAAAWIGFLAPL